MVRMATEPRKTNKPATDKPIEALGVELGVSQNLPFTTPFSIEAKALRGGSINEELHELMRNEYGEDSGPTIPQLVAMRRMDGQARALYSLLTMPIRAALKGSSFIPAEGGDKEAEFVTNAFTLPPESGGMSVTLSRVMAQILQALFDGFAPFEKVYHIPSKGPLKGKVTLKKLMYLPVETVTFVVDKKGGYRGLRQRANFAGESVDVYIPPQYAFYYTAREEEKAYYGVSYFQSAFYHYDKKMKQYFLGHLASQRAAVGTRVGTVPPTATVKAKREFAEALANLAFAQYILAPEGFEVEILREGATFDFLNFINHHNSQMSKSVLAAFFDESQGSGSNDNAMIGGSGPGDDWFNLQLQAIQDEIASVINTHVIPDIVDANFNGGKYPKFQWGTLTEDQKAAVSKMFGQLSTSGQNTNVTPEFMREMEKKQAEALGFDIDYEEIEKREKEEAQRLIEAGIDPKTGVPFPQPIDPATGQPAIPGGVDENGNPKPSDDAQIAGLVQQAAQLSKGSQADIVMLARDLLEEAGEFIRKGDSNDNVH